MYTQPAENNKRWWDIPSLIFLIVGLWVTVIRFSVTKWTDQLERVELLVLIALALGVLLGKSRFSRGTVRLLAFVYTLFFVGWQTIAFVGTEYSWMFRLRMAAARINNVVYYLLHNQPAEDTILFFAIMGLFFWLLAISSVYLLVRYGQPWVPVLIAGLGLLIIDQYNIATPNRDRYIIIYLLCLLSLVGRVFYLHARADWIEKGITIDSDTGFNLGRTIMIGGLVLILVAWNIPVFASAINSENAPRTGITKAWRELRDRMSNAMAGLENPVIFVNDNYASSMSLGTEVVEGDEVVFTVDVSARSDNFRYYWRGNSYDFFDGTTWRNSIETRNPFKEDEWPFEQPDLRGRRRVQLNFDLLSPTTQKLYVPNFPLYVDHNIEYVGEFEETVDEPDVDLIALLASPPLRSGDQLQARAWVSEPTIEMLRAAGDDYPDWVKDRYLSVPPNFSDRVRLKANEITISEQTNYDKVVAVTQYLRDTITYVKSIEAPPGNQDTLEWFLFDYQKGFCNYYATAEVMMLRSVGIPARVSTGYSQGEWDPDNEKYIVRLKDFHAWPEVYFPGVGWIEFEPTVDQPPLVYRERATNDEGSAPGFAGDVGSDQFFRGLGFQEEIEDPSPVESTPLPDPRRPWIIGLSITIVVLLGVAVFLRLNPKWRPGMLILWVENSYTRRGREAPKSVQRWARYVESKPIERLFGQINWMLWLLRKDNRASLTPAEKVTRIVDTVPASTNSAGVFLDEFHKALFSRHPYDIGLARRAHWSLWKQVSSFVTKRILRIQEE